jgi:hypothetical protein
MVAENTGPVFSFSVDGTKDESTGSPDHFLKLMTDELESLKKQILEQNDEDGLKYLVNKTGEISEQAQIRLAAIIAAAGEESAMAAEMDLQIVVVQIGCVTLASWAMQEFLKKRESLEAKK